MKNLPDRIAIDQEICGGRPAIKRTRMKVKTVPEYLAAGQTGLCQSVKRMGMQQLQPDGCGYYRPVVERRYAC